MIQFRGFEEEQPPERPDLRRLRGLWPFVRPYRRSFATGLAILGVSLVLEIALPFVVRYAIDGPITAAVEGRGFDASAVGWLVATFLAITAGSLALGYWFAMVTTGAGQRVIRDVRVRLFDHVLRLPLDFFSRQSAGRLVTRVTTDVENLSELITTGVLLTLFDLVTIAGILGILFWLDVRIALFAIAITPIFVLLSLAFRRFARHAYADVRGRLGRQNGFLGEMLAGVRTTRAYGREDEVLAHWADLNRQTRRGWIRTVQAYAAFFFAVDVALRLGTAGLLWFGGHAILGGTLTTGLFVQAWLYFGKLSDPIRELGEKYNVLQSALASAARIQTLFAERAAPAEPSSPRPSTASRDTPAELRFEGVRFSYRPDEPVLEGIDLDVPAGTTCALVGPTGAGKSTLLALASRLYDPDEGRVVFDGAPATEYSLRDLRGQIAVVPQDVFLFRGTVRDNVRLFDESIDDDRVRSALETVGALGFVEAMDGGLDAPVEERGETFSLGERQLLSFARALVTEPRVLVLDEATAHVDTATEERLQRALEPLLHGRTCLVVAHRLSTVRRADRIAVVEAGRIVEAGDHATLIRAEGVYARMIAAGHATAG